MNARDRISVALPFLLSVTLGAMGCSSAPEPTPEPTPTRPEGVSLCYTELADNHPATKAFWDALGANDHDARAAAIAGLDAAASDHPDEEELALLRGLAHLWRLAEPLPGEATDQAIMVQSALASRQALERAYELCPTDHRIPAWLGPVLVNTGRAVGNQGMVDEGLAVLQQGIDHYPSFVLFSKLLIYANEPSTDPNFQQALDAVFDNEDACAKTPLDPACINSAHAAHNVEGAMVFMGDVFAKGDRREDALRYYNRAKEDADYATWDFQALLDDRIATIDSRVAAHQNADPSDDPAVAWASDIQCALCHSR